MGVKAKTIKRILSVIVCVVLLASSAQLQLAYAQNSDEIFRDYYGNNTVKVGWFEQSGMQYTTGSGNRNGYCYDLYRRIGIYNNITYEYVDATFEQCLELLRPDAKDGIDILAGVAYNVEGAEFYDYSTISIGAFNSMLVSRAEDADLYADSTSFNGKRVALARGRFVSNVADEYFEQLGAGYVPVVCEGFDACAQALENGEADLAIICNYQVANKDLSVIHEFSPMHIYFAVSKGNEQLLNSVNSALEDITTLDPEFFIRLYEKYFAQSEVDNYIPLEAAREVLEDKQTINVYLDEKSTYLNDNITMESFGVTRDFVEKTAGMLGLEVNYLTSQDGAINKLLADGKVDVVPGFYYDYSWAADCGVEISSPYLSVQCYKIGEGETVAAVSNSTIAKFYVLPNYDGSKIVWCDDVNDCIGAVKSGKADTTYVDDFTLNNYYYSFGRGALDAQLCQFQYNNCFAFSAKLDPAIQMAFTRAIMSISRAEREQILEKNEIAAKNLAQNVAVIVMIIGSAAVLILLIVLSAAIAAVVRKSKKKNEPPADNFLIYTKQPEKKELEPEPDDIIEQPKPASPQPDENNPLSGRHALLAEDNEMNAEIVANLLSSFGLIVDIARDGKQALEKFSSSDADFYDIIVMDVNMPVMNGIEATEAIRALERDDAGEIPIIALSGSSFEDDVTQCLECGMDAHLSKPVDPEEIKQVLLENMA